MFSKTLKKHLVYLYKIFKVFDLFNIRFSSKKLYLKYLIIALLNQKIDVFNLIIVVDKLTVIINFRFFLTFKNLKNYFDFIE